LDFSLYVRILTDQYMFKAAVGASRLTAIRLSAHVQDSSLLRRYFCRWHADLWACWLDDIGFLAIGIGVIASASIVVV
jgi:hypothetical protein